MKRVVLGVILGLLAAGTTPLALLIRGTGGAVLLAMDTLPLAFIAGLVLPYGATQSPLALSLVAFFNWLIIGWVAGGIVFREKTLDARITR